ncbi:MAG: 50S ribosomal protein L18 [Candidatus Krumholzibacteria bacterium]|nr:50S ribosomal protein L18 [Candidatus Krumholzibacteria bacterium]
MRDKNREKRQARLNRHKRVRSKVFGTAECPRLTVYRSLGHMYSQIIDDSVGTTLVASSSLKIELSPASGEDKPEGLKMRRSRAVGKAIAEAAVAKGIKKVVFDRGGRLYHGRVAVFGEAARKAGLEF